MESGKLYKSSDIWKAHYNSTFDSNVSSTLLNTLFGGPVTYPVQNIYDDETGRLITARQNAMNTNIDLVHNTIEKVYNHIQEKSFRAVCDTLRGAVSVLPSSSTTESSSSSNRNNALPTRNKSPGMDKSFIPTIFVYGALQSVDNNAYFRKLEETIINEMYVRFSSSIRHFFFIARITGRVKYRHDMINIYTGLFLLFTFYYFYL